MMLLVRLTTITIPTERIMKRQLTSSFAAANWRIGSKQPCRRKLTSHSGSNNNIGPNDNKYLTYAKGFGVGTVAGMLGSLAGMGGGFVMIPMMTSPLLRLTQHQAHGTSLFAVASTGIAGALSYGDAVQYEAALAVAASGIIFARFGATATSYLSSGTLKFSLGVLMLCMAPAIPLKAYVEELSKEKESIRNENEPEQKDKVSASSTLNRFLIPAGIGMGSGFLAGMFGVGGGVIVVPALTIFCDMTHYQALGTSLAAMVLPAVSGTYTHYVMGNVATRVAPGLALGSFTGAYIGGKIGLKTDEFTLRLGFSGLLTLLGIRTIIKA